MIKLRFFAVIIGVLACASVDNVIVAEPGVAFSLPVGKTAALGGNGSRITFTRVTEESRCPTSVVCVWEGDAKIEVTVSRDGGAPASRVFSLKVPDNEGRVGDLFVRFVSLAPYPRNPGPADPRAYVAELVIRKL
jgi:hypothetical protein